MSKINFGGAAAQEQAHDSKSEKKDAALSYNEIAPATVPRDEKSNQSGRKETDGEAISLNPAANEEVKRRKRIDRMANKMNAVMWLATPALYCILSYIFGGWGKWWLLFISSSAGSVIIDIFRELNLGASKKKIRGHLIGLMWLISVMAYFLLSFRLGWKMTWLVFIAAAIVSALLGDSDGDKDNNGTEKD